MLKFCEAVWPSTMLPKLKVEGETLRPGCVPVPESEIERGEPVASLVTVTLPVTLPPAVGANVMVNVAVCEGFRVAGTEMPLTLKPVPLAETAEMWTAPLPVLVRTICLAEFEPAATLPKLRLVGLALSWPTAATPVPLTETDSGEFEASLVRVMLPVALPALVGAKVTVRVAVCDAFRVAGTVKPLTVKPEPLALTAET